jgi:hypothetical protein
MKQRTEGRVVRFLTKRHAAEKRSLEQWFLVAIDDDERARDAVSKTTKATDEVIEVVGRVPTSSVAGWSQVRLVLHGELLGG